MALPDLPHGYGLDGPTLDALKRKAKRQLRQRMRALRGALPAPALAIRNAALVERLILLPEVAEARRIALYFPMEERKEVDLRPLDAACRARGVAVYYPRITEGVTDGGTEGVTERVSEDVSGRPAPKGLDFALVDSVSELEESGHGFREPPAGIPGASAGELDAIIVPALAVSGSGHRLGYGSGFYDRVLPGYCPPARSVVVAYDFQLLAELPETEGDVACNIVVTDVRVIRT